MGPSHENRDRAMLLDFPCAGEGLPVIGREKGGDAHQVRLFAGRLSGDFFERGPEVVVMMETAEGALIRIRIIISKMNQFIRQSDGFSPVPPMVIPDLYLHRWQEFF
jgi:hypothetical protein